MISHTILDFSLLQTLMEVLATLAFTLSGMLEAARKRLDMVGVCVVAGLEGPFFGLAYEKKSLPAKISSGEKCSNSKKISQRKMD